MAPPRLEKRRLSEDDGQPPAAVVTKRVRVTLDTLPDEIVVWILRYLPQADCINLQRSSRRFKRPCMIRLYRSIIICDKPDDPYYKTLTESKGTTLLSSWVDIVQFFEYIYLGLKRGKSLEFLPYVEEIISYNYLDTEKVDKFRNKVLPIDLQNKFRLRQTWDAVIESFPNLKKLILPLQPFSKLQMLNPRVFTNLQSLSMHCSSWNSSVPELPSLKTLRINLSDKAPEKDLPALLSKFSKAAPSVKHLELNGEFGLQDRILEHTLRHSRLSDRLSTKTAYVEGFVKGASGEFEAHSLLSEPNSSQSSDILDFDDIGNRLVERTIVGDRYTGLQENLSQQISFAKFWTSTWELESLTFANLMHFYDNVAAGHLLQIFQFLTSSIRSKSLKAIHFRSFDETPINFDRATIYNGLILNIFAELEHREYDALECLTICDTIRPELDHADAENAASSILGSIRRMSSKIKEIRFYNNFQKLDTIEALEILKSLDSKRDSLKKLSYYRHSNIQDICNRLVSAKAMKSSTSTVSYGDIDDSLYMNSRAAVEFMNWSHRIDYYEQHHGIITQPEFVAYFQDEFMYLYGGLVKPFFEEYPLLKTFVFYGFPFQREMFNFGRY